MNGAPRHRPAGAELHGRHADVGDRCFRPHLHDDEGRPTGVALQRPAGPTRLLQIAEDVDFLGVGVGAAGLGFGDADRLRQVGAQPRRLDAVERLRHVIALGRRPLEE